MIFEKMSKNFTAKNQFTANNSDKHEATTSGIVTKAPFDLNGTPPINIVPCCNVPVNKKMRLEQTKDGTDNIGKCSANACIRR